ncbi:PREDICTED: epithelial chloride channel protein-like [Nanorana parkeri]|uniref:epithelial chloride channel protein-like n=1 Tax=Nanorana parkeri TaxID=125878 RepID=UPI0008544C1C|nr:PREDICTED: epithelial chloride channel protein-like [Nanorana parkeri]
MALSSIFNIFVFLHLFPVIHSSFIRLNNGGYDDITIAIHPGLQEDTEIIERIKEMVIDASSYLFNATENRLYINSVNILVPSTWTSKNDYVKRQRETYKKADVIIENPFPKYGDDPYTLQYRGCGAPGEYIHLTPNFMLNDSLASVYGSAGRVFVHEWAHLRWGVFDEYSTEKPYYISSELKIEATRCSETFKGSNLINKCEGDTCTLRSCNIDSKTGLYEEGCLFLPEKDQNVQQSIMYLQSLSSVSAFCNDSNHNLEAPNLQNRMCNLYSTWEVIKNSTDISSTSPRPNGQISTPTFTLLQYKTQIITVAIDISGSMKSFDRIGRMYQAAEFFFMHVIETGSYAGIVEFASYAFATSKLVKINSHQDRETLISKVPSTTLNEVANICVGIQKALKVNKQFNGATAGTEIILVTDSEYNISKCIDAISDSGAAIHVIALGSEAAQQLENIADITGGQKHFATDRLSNDLIEAFSAITKGDGDFTQQAILLDSTSFLLKQEECLNNTVFIDNTVGTSTFFLVTWQTAVPTINLEDPKGNLYMEAQFTNNTISNSSRLQIPGKAESGIWHYSLCNSLKSPQVIGMVVTSKAADINVPPVTASVHMSQDTGIYPKPMIVYASVRQGTMPVIGVKVTATIESESGNSLSFDLLDNGAGADTFKNDGVYSKYFFAFTENGRHNVKIHVVGAQTVGKTAVTRSSAFYVPGYVENDMSCDQTPIQDTSETTFKAQLKKISPVIFHKRQDLWKNLYFTSSNCHCYNNPAYRYNNTVYRYNPVHRYNNPVHRYNHPFHRYNNPTYRYSNTVYRYNPVHRYNNPVHRYHNLVYRYHNTVYRYHNHVYRYHNTVYRYNNTVYRYNNTVHRYNNTVYRYNNTVYRYNNPVHRYNTVYRYHNTVRYNNPVYRYHNTVHRYNNTVCRYHNTVYRYHNPVHRHNTVYRYNNTVYRYNNPVYRYNNTVYRHNNPVYRYNNTVYIYNNTVHRYNTVYRYNNTVYRYNNTVYRHNNPVYRYNNTVYRYNTSVYRYHNTFYRYNNPVYRYNNPVYRYHNPVHRYNNTFYRYNNTVYRYNNTIYRYNNPVYRYHNTVHRYHNTVYRYNNTIYRYNNPVYRYNNTVYRYNNTGYRHNNPVYRYHNPVHRYNNTVYRYNNTVHRYNNTVYRYNNTVYRYNNTLYRYNNPVYRYHNPVHRYNNTFYRYNNTVYRYNNIFYRYNNTVYRYNNTFYRYNNTVYRCNNPVYRYNNTVYRYNNPVYRYNNTVYRYNNTVYRYNNTVYRHNNTVYRYNNTVYRYNNTVYRHNNPVYRYNNTVYRYNNTVYRYNNTVY